MRIGTGANREQGTREQGVGGNGRESGRANVCSCLTALSIFLQSRSFPTGQFNLPGFSAAYKKDVSGKSGGLLVYVNSSIQSKLLKVPDCLSNIQVIPVEVNLRKQKWLLVAIYTPPS